MVMVELMTDIVQCRQLAVKLDAPHVIGHGEGEAKVLTLDG